MEPFLGQTTPTDSTDSMSTDGYSSDEDEQDFKKQSSVLLGFTDIEIEEEEPTIEDSFIGGTPIWLHPDSQPDEDMLNCKNCSGRTALILQAFSPLEGTLYDRVIYVFGCQKAGCRRTKGSIRVIRGVAKDPKKISELKKKEEEEIKKSLDEKLKLDEPKNFLFDDKKAESNPFGASSNPFGSSDNPFGSSNPFDASKTEPKKESSTSFASVAQKAAPKPQPKPRAPKSNDPLPQYPGYFIYVDQEKFNKKEKASSLPENFKLDESAFDLESEVSTGGLSSETQAISNSLQDRDFQHFEEVVSYNPLQVLRYELGGKPLLFSSKDDTAAKVLKNLVPKPGYNPSSQRQFELQIMPKVIMDLERDITDIVNDGIEWVTIIVYSDVEDYVPKLDEYHVGYVEEWVGVQWEERTK